MSSAVDLIEEGIRNNNMKKVADGYKMMFGKTIEIGQDKSMLALEMVQEIVEKFGNDVVKDNDGDIEEKQEEKKPKKRGRPAKKKDIIKKEEQKKNVFGRKVEFLSDPEDENEKALNKKDAEISESATKVRPKVYKKCEKCDNPIGHKRTRRNKTFWLCDTCHSEMLKDIISKKVIEK